MSSAMRHLLPAALAAVLAATAAGPLHAQWKWRDKSGQIHASDLPPPRDIADKDVLQRPAAPVRRASPPAAAASAASAAPGLVPAAAPRVDPELEARRRAAEEQQRQKQAQEEQRVAAARAENCERARAQLRTLDSGIRVARVNDKGEREILDDAQRADEVQRARNVVASDCR